MKSPATAASPTTCTRPVRQLLRESPLDHGVRTAGQPAVATAQQPERAGQQDASPAAKSRRPAATCARPGPRESRRAPAVDWLRPSAATSVLVSPASRSTSSGQTRNAVLPSISTAIAPGTACVVTRSGPPLRTSSWIRSADASARSGAAEPNTVARIVKMRRLAILRSAGSLVASCCTIDVAACAAVCASARPGRLKAQAASSTVPTIEKRLRRLKASPSSPCAVAPIAGVSSAARRPGSLPHAS